MAVDTASLTAALSDWGERVFVEAAGDMRDLLVEAAPEGETGELKASIVAVIGSTGLVNTGSIETDAPQAAFTNDGTRPHPIVGSPLLAFSIGGETVIVHSVAHPGNAATHWWDNTATEAAWLEALEQAAEAFPLLA